MTRERQRMLSTQNDAADQQPWRCAKCGRAVRKGYNDPCDCHPNLTPTPTTKRRNKTREQRDQLAELVQDMLPSLKERAYRERWNSLFTILRRAEDLLKEVREHQQR